MYIRYTVFGEPQPGFIARDGARGHGPRANGLMVGVVGDGGCRPFLRGALKAARGSPQSRLPSGVRLGAGIPRALLTEIVVCYVGDTHG